MKWFRMLEFRASIYWGVVRGSISIISPEFLARRVIYLKAAVSFFHPQSPGNKATK